MYSYIFFGLFILGIFSIIENIKGNQKISLIKLNFLLFLIFSTIISFLEFLFELGIDLTLYSAIIRLFSTIYIINIFYIVANNRVPKIVLIIEAVFFLIYFIAILNGFRFLSIHEGKFYTLTNIFIKFNYFVTNPLALITMCYNIIKIQKKSDDFNQYQLKIKKWSLFLLLLFIIMFVSVTIPMVLFYSNGSMKLVDSRGIRAIYRVVLILFILFRPKFIDESGFAFSINHIKNANDQVSLQNFEFLFYGNQYFLQPDANLENFALRLNHTKSEVLDFIKKQTSDSFTELVNKNRINYFKEMLKSKQHESFTIEALSEMSGFNNRQSMYNAFKKYEGCSPSDYINNL